MALQAVPVNHFLWLLGTDETIGQLVLDLITSLPGTKGMLLTQAQPRSGHRFTITANW
jgi:hypothetical protein